MSRPGSNKLLTTSNALVKLQRRQLQTAAASAAAAARHQQHQLLLLAGSPSNVSGSPSTAAGTGSTPSAAAASTGEKASHAQLSFDFTAHHPPPASAGSSSVRTRRASSSSSAPRPPANSPREPATLAQQPPSPTQNHALPLAAAPLSYGNPSPLDLWASEAQPATPPAHVRSERTQRFVFETGTFGIPRAAALSTSAVAPSLSSSKGKARADAPLAPPDGSVYQNGEDAYFLRTTGLVQALGIADGVGGWSRRKDVSNANAGRFCNLLMSHISAEVGRSSATPSRLVFDWAVSRGLDVPGSGEEELDPVRLMQAGYTRCLEQAREEGLHGSATALLALLKEDQLRIANVGDCSLTLIRNGEIFFRTNEMQHAFNKPFQLGTNSRDSPANDSQYYSIQVKREDIVVLCTDGLVDNLFDEELLEEISAFQQPRPGASPSSPLTFPASRAGGSRSSSPSSLRTASCDTTSFPHPVSSPSSRPTSPSRPTPLPLSPQRIAEALCSRAKARSEQGRFLSAPGSPSPSAPDAPDASSTAAAWGENLARDSPFAVKARKEGFAYHGAKPDDISVLVAIVGEAPVAPAPTEPLA